MRVPISSLISHTSNRSANHFIEQITTKITFNVLLTSIISCEAVVLMLLRANIQLKPKTKLLKMRILRNTTDATRRKDLDDKSMFQVKFCKYPFILQKKKNHNKGSYKQKLALGNPNI